MRFKHPFRDYAIYRGLTHNYGDYNYHNDDNGDGSGCGCLIVIIIIIGLAVLYSNLKADGTNVYTMRMIFIGIIAAPIFIMSLITYFVLNPDNTKGKKYASYFIYGSALVLYKALSFIFPKYNSIILIVGIIFVIIWCIYMMPKSTSSTNDIKRLNSPRRRARRYKRDMYMARTSPYVTYDKAANKIIDRSNKDYVIVSTPGDARVKVYKTHNFNQTQSR